ncbi:VanZ family protein [Nocardioides sp. YIM 152315]|uniref:VanZ family protein n=1 Tax=Nocardioides sp. YIM 152315 TaxID=3031760 RepID=UPI0023DBDCE0|nr:VanZ family protein [Nocardioides sp. YIM 152315]MDF1605001.1 VanZ family protein [Nocardioides sp. YIM 152315]
MGLSDRTRRWLLAALAAYVALLALALLAPTSGTQSGMASWVRDIGVTVGFDPERATQARAEFLCNALILAPVSALGSVLWPRTTWRDWTAWTFGAAVLVELAQGLLLPARTASNVDIVANTLGGLLGALTVAVSRRRTAAGTPPSHQDEPRPVRGRRS